MSGKLKFEKETHELIGSAMEVHRELGHGLSEKPYERALAVEMGIRKIAFLQQPTFDIKYKGQTVGKYIPDLIAYNKIIIDTKAISRITDHEVGQMLTYLRVTQLPIGLIINFANKSLEWRRVILSENQNPQSPSSSC